MADITTTVLVKEPFTATINCSVGPASLWDVLRQSFVKYCVSFSSTMATTLYWLYGAMSQPDNYIFVGAFQKLIVLV